MTIRFIALAIAISMIQLTALSQVTIQQSVKDEDPRARAEFEFNRLKDPKSGKIPDRMREKELSFARALPTSKAPPRLGNSTQSLEALSWTGRGPVNVGGRTRALGVDVTNPNIMLAGGVSGGLWRSSNAGATWTLVSGGSQLHSISCIVQDTRAGHTDTWYYGTGELNGNSASAGGGPYRGDGCYKSTDDGLTWRKLASTSSGTPQNFDSGFDYMWNLAINPADPFLEEVYAATFGAILHSTDGGDSWTTVLGGFSTVENNGSPYSRYSDIVVSSTGVIYAALSQQAEDGSFSASAGIYRSVDGNTWTNLFPDPLSYNRVVLGLSPSNENVLYIIMETPGTGHKTTYAGAEEDHTFLKYTYISGDGSGSGGSFEDRSANLPSFGQPVGEFASQGGYDLVVKVKPDDENVVFLGGTDLFRSTNGFSDTLGTSWIGGYSTANNVNVYFNHHPDQHAIVFSPTSPTTMFSGNDGGVQVTTNNMATNVSWTWLNNGYFTSQFYTIAIDHGTSGNDVIVGGTQDNGTWFTNNSNTSSLWRQPLGGDGTFCAVADGRSSYYGSFPGKTYRLLLDGVGTLTGFTRVDPTGGSGYLFVNPFILDPTNTNRMYLAGGTRIWRNDDLTAIPLSSGSTTSVNWTNMTNTVVSGTTVTALGVSVNPPNRLYYGRSNGHVYRVDNAQTGNPPQTDVSGVNFPSGGYVNCVAVDPSNADNVLAVFSNYLVVSLFYSTDGGSSWNAVAGNLEQFPDGSGNGPSVRWAQILAGSYFVGTSTGLYSTTALNGSSTVWSQEGSSTIGNAIIEMIDYRQSDGRIVAATHGNGIYSSFVDLAPPVTPTLVFPPDSATGQFPSLSMRWTPSPSAFQYHLQVSLDSLFGSLTYEDSSVTDTTTLAGPFADSTMLFWRVRARNTLGWSPFSTVSRFKTGFSVVSATYNNRWYLVSVPVELPDYRKNVVFATTISSAYQYDSAYTPKDTLEIGRGYWLKFPSAETLTVVGNAVTLDSIDLAAGWNLVGSITTPVARSQVETDPPGIITSNMFTYDGGYRITDTVRPLQGHWVKTSAPGRMILHSAGGSAKRSNIPDAQASLGEFNALEFTDVAGNSSKIYFGMSTAAGAFELPPPAPQGAFDVRYESNRFLETNDGQSLGVYKIHISSSAFPVTVKWTTNRQPFAASLRAGGKSVSLQSYGSLQVGTPDVVLRLGKESSVPKEFALDQNFPNPFNPVTVLGFRVPTTSHVRLKVYDLTGREVSTIVDEVLSPGVYTRKWDARDIASGVYFYRMEGVAVNNPVTTFSQSRMMTVLK